MQRPIIAALMLFALGACDNEATETAAQSSAIAKVAPAPAPPPADPHRNDYKKPTVKGSVAFEGLEDGGTIEGKSIVGMVAADLKFKVEGMAVREEGPVAVDTGHFVVIVDGQSIPEGTTASEETKIYRYGKGEMGGVVPLSEGEHKLTLQFVDARDRSYGEPWSQTISVKAKSKK